MNTTSDNSRRPSGVLPAFTLMEVMITVAIIVLLVSLLLVAMGGFSNSAKRNVTRQALKNAQGISDEFSRINNGYVLVLGSPSQYQYEDNANPPGDLVGKTLSYSGTIPGGLLPAGFAASAPPPAHYLNAMYNSLEFVAATNAIPALAATYNSFPKGSLASVTNGTTTYPYLVDGWGFPIVYVAYCTGALNCVEPTTGNVTTYATLFTHNRPFFMSSGVPGTTYGDETAPNGASHSCPPAVGHSVKTQPNAYNGRQPPNMFSFDEMSQ
jgi:type II secretory pathway pseudopilin PulG